MWERRYSPRQYVEGRKLPVPVVLSRLHGPARNGPSYRSTYGVWNNDDFGLRGGGLWDDVLFQGCHRDGGSTPPERSTTPRRAITPQQKFNYFDALATPRRSGQCGPRCKRPRCAAIEHANKPYWGANKWKEIVMRNRPPRRVKKTCTTMDNIQVQDKIDDITKGLGNLKKVIAARELEDLPGEEQICERKCGECSNTGQELIVASATTATEAKPTRTQGTNTVATYSAKYNRRECEIPVRVLKEQTNNIMEEKSTSRAKPTPIPRVALLKQPKAKPYENLTICQLRTPPLHPWVSSPHLTSRRRNPRKPRKECQKVMDQGKLAPRIYTPPTPRCEPSPKEDSNLPPEPTNPCIVPIQAPCQPIPPPQPTVSCGKSVSSEGSYSRATTASECDSSSECAESSNRDESCEEAMLRRCCLCGKSENVGSRNNPDAYRNNPLYSPQQSLTREGPSPSPGPSATWRFFYTLLEVLLWVALGGALTWGLIPYVESIFRAYMADYCRCSATDVVGKAGAGPELTANGMHSGVTKWVTCMKDSSTATTTHLRRR